MKTETFSEAALVMSAVQGSIDPGPDSPFYGIGSDDVGAGLAPDLERGLTALAGFELLARATGARPAAILCGADRRANVEPMCEALLALAASVPAVEVPAAMVSDIGGAVLGPAGTWAVFGTKALNLGLARRALEGLADAAQPAVPAPIAPAFADPSRRAIWRLAEVVQRTVVPRDLILAVGDETISLRAAGGRIVSDDVELAGRLSALLGAASAEGQPIRYRLACSEGSVEGPSADPVTLLRTDRRDPPRTVSDTEWLAFDAEGWPRTILPESSFASVSRGARLAAAMTAWARTSGATTATVLLGGKDRSVRPVLRFGGGDDILVLGSALAEDAA